MVYALLKTIHLLAAVVWLGGMFFTLFCLHPAAALLQPAERVPVVATALGRFFRMVEVSIVVLLASGGWMVWRVASTTRRTGLPFNIFGHIRFALFRRVQRARAAQDWPAAAAALASVRGWVAINMTIGVVVVLVTLMGTAT
jgi:uncharacterized membrane protein